MAVAFFLISNDVAVNLHCWLQLCTAQGVNCNKNSREVDGEGVLILFAVRLHPPSISFEYAPSLVCDHFFGIENDPERNESSLFGMGPDSRRSFVVVH